jgi:uncharacterized protein with HEPN domain
LQREPRAYLWEACERADAIAEMLRGHSLADYLADRVLRWAVERQFTVIGEALNQLAKVAPEIAARIPELPQVVAFRNVPMHGYEGIIASTVWSAAQEKLPALRARVAALLAEPGDAP